MIVVEHLTKRYGNVVAVDDLSFVARPGAVTGFLGPNGAGKSTSMRMMTALTPVTSGTATVLGRRYRDIPNPGRQVGVMLDASAQHPGRTGREILSLAAMQLGLDKKAVGTALARVGLTEKEAGRRVRNYSLGMRQRLGIGAALLAQPEVLILDEPANGLDPQGIRWMRGLLREFADNGGTVLLSSHLLHEVELIADELIMIGHGRLVAAGSKQELIGARGTVVMSTDNQRLADALAAGGIATRPHETGFIAECPTETVGRAALEAQVVLTELRNTGSEGLEEMFLQLTASTAREESTP